MTLLDEMKFNFDGFVNQVEKLLGKNQKVTIIVRDPGNSDADFIMSTDSKTEVIDTLQKSEF